MGVEIVEVGGGEVERVGGWEYLIVIIIVICGCGLSIIFLVWVVGVWGMGGRGGWLLICEGLVVLGLKEYY